MGSWGDLEDFYSEINREINHDIESRFRIRAESIKKAAFIATRPPQNVKTSSGLILIGHILGTKDGQAFLGVLPHEQSQEVLDYIYTQFNNDPRAIDDIKNALYFDLVCSVEDLH